MKKYLIHNFLVGPICVFVLLSFRQPVKYTEVATRCSICFTMGWCLATYLPTLHGSKGKRTFLVAFNSEPPMSPSHNLSVFPESIRLMSGIWVVKAYEIEPLKIHERLRPYLVNGCEAVVFDVTGRGWAMNGAAACLEWMKAACQLNQPSEPEG